VYWTTINPITSADKLDINSSHASDQSPSDLCNQAVHISRFDDQALILIPRSNEPLCFAKDATKRTVIFRMYFGG